jgi:peptidoglycan/xylan/chitin deacetylase (PgdA/CDA1 family)
VFEQYLEIIDDEGYTTLTSSDLAAIVLGRATPPPRACLITFDDACADVWAYAGPLLERHHMRATVFAILNRLQASGGTRPTLEDVWAGRCATGDLYQLPELRRINARALEPDYAPATDHVSVEEARVMAALGVCDIQSHGLDHSVHYTSDRLTGFLCPQSHWTSIAAARGDRRLGTPIYETSSVLAGPRYGDPQAIRDHLANVVANAGGVSFFDNAGWSGILRSEFDAALARTGTGQCESEEAWKTSMLVDLERCIRELSALTGHAVHALAWPFGSNSEQSRQVAVQSGFALAYTRRRVCRRDVTVRHWANRHEGSRPRAVPAGTAPPFGRGLRPATKRGRAERFPTRARRVKRCPVPTVQSW